MKRNSTILIFAGLLLLTLNCKKENGTADKYTVSTLPGHFIGPGGIAVDATGNVYVIDQTNRISKITPGGEVNYSFAGSGEFGYEDGPGISAKFNFPRDLATDSRSNIYVADEYNHRIRKISPEGVVGTLAGDGVPGYADGIGTAAEFNRPVSIASDASGILYVVDFENACIRKITQSGDVSTFTVSFVGSGPHVVATDAGGGANIYCLTYSDFLKISPGGDITTINHEAFYLVTDIVSDEQGNIFFVRSDRNAICMINASGNITTIAGSGNFEGGYADGSGSSAQFNYPVGLARDAHGNLYVTDSGNDKVRKISLK